MAWLEKRGNKFRIKYRHAGRNESCRLKTGDHREAQVCLARFEENFRLFERGRLELPPGADLGIFLLSDGKLNHRATAAKPTTLGELIDHYLNNHPEGAKEATTRYTERIHVKHLQRHLGEATLLSDISTETLQAYVNSRSKEKSKFRQGISHTTVRKELATLSAIWSKWGIPQGLVTSQPPTRGLINHKGKQKLPFQTRKQIERQIVRGGLTQAQIAALWESQFLSKEETAELLRFVEGKSPMFIYPMFVFAAYTGARRSEMLRSQVEDIDFANGVVMIREKKRDRSKELTTRTVPMATMLAQVMREWLTRHPGGQFTFVERADDQISPQRASQHFRGVLDGSKWSVLSGWHTLRHSFASNLAASNIDQRIIDSFMGHQTEAMRLRYRHLFPERQQQAINLAFVCWFGSCAVLFRRPLIQAL
jgi:integrase